MLSYTRFYCIHFTTVNEIADINFYEIDKVYTYLSPDIEYFQGRHLITIWHSSTVVYNIHYDWSTSSCLHLSFSLIIKYFLNVKPLLNQFQQCYKDKYHCFADYYMICQLLIIAIVIANYLSNDLVAN